MQARRARCASEWPRLVRILAIFALLAAAAGGQLFAADPQIDEQPVSMTAPVGSSATFRVRASGTSPLSFLWFKNNFSIPNRTSPDLTISRVTAADAGAYQVLVSNRNGAVLSAIARLTLEAVEPPNPPIINAHPTSTTVRQGVTARFAVVATGAHPLSYQWIKDGVDVAFGISGELLISNTTFDDAGVYRVRVRNPGGAVLSEPATLVVIPAVSGQLLVKTVAGNGAPGFKDSNNALEGQLHNPNSLAVSQEGVTFLADTANHAVRFITPGGALGTVAGHGGIAGFRDGGSDLAQFHHPLAVQFDRAGRLLVADTDNNRVRTVIVGGWPTVGTLAGNGRAALQDGSSAQASFNFPNDLVLDNAGNVFVSEFNNHTIRKIARDGTVTTFAGNGTSGNQDGRGTNAQFNRPGGLAIDRANNLYVTEWSNHRVRKILPDGTVSTIAGRGIPGFRDGVGIEAQFNTPDGIAVDAEGMIYVSEYGNNAIRRITPTGVVTTLAGDGQPGFADGDGSVARFNRPGGITLHPNGTLIIADTGNHRIRSMTLTPRVNYLSNAIPYLVLDLNASLTISGKVGKTYRIETATESAPGNWVALTNITLGSPVQTWTDPEPIRDQKRFYRAVLP
ncbi:MAG: immunoglobulin domain-containing protein [Verrucomicrobiota bacterium]